MSERAKGYGWPHQQRRAMWTRKVEAGGVVCARCGKPIVPGSPWDLDHTDDRSEYLGPSHSSCNRAKGARAKVARPVEHPAQFRNPEDGRPWSREW